MEKAEAQGGVSFPRGAAHRVAIYAYTVWCASPALMSSAASLSTVRNHFEDADGCWKFTPTTSLKIKSSSFLRKQAILPQQGTPYWKS